MSKSSKEVDASSMKRVVISGKGAVLLFSCSVIPDSP